MLLQFTKMHGLGNDYILIDERNENLIPENQKSEFSQAVSSRGFDIGSDGVLFIGTPENANVQMRIFNADGSEAESCGNGLRCTAYFHHGIGKPGSSEMEINLPLSKKVHAEVHSQTNTRANVQLELPEAGKYEGLRQLELKNCSLDYHRIDVGNPHAVMFVEENQDALSELDKINVPKLGTQIQNHPDFTDTGGINAEFVDHTGEGEVEMRVHERGVGPTSSCGTGCVAIARACSETGRSTGWVAVKQPGGTLHIENQRGFLKGSAEVSYQGLYQYDPDS